MIRLEVGPDGVRPVGFFSRDRADEAVGELDALLRHLSPDGRPWLYVWEREAGKLVLRPFPVAPDGSAWSWEPDSGRLVGEAGGLAIVAVPKERGWSLRLAGRELRGGPPYADEAGHALGPKRILDVRAETARVGRELTVRLRFADGVALPRDAVVEGVWSGVSVGRGRPTADGYAWDVPKERPPEPWTLTVQTDVQVGEDVVRADVSVVEATSFYRARALVRGQAVDFVKDGDVVEGVVFGDIGAMPKLVTFELTAEAQSTQRLAEQESRENPKSASARLCVLRASAVSQSAYHFDVPWKPRIDRLPARLTVTCPGQDTPVGTITIVPARFPGRWRLTRDDRGDAVLPKLDPRSVVLRDHRDWKPDGGLVRVEADGVVASAPLVDGDFVPLLLADVDRPLWDAPRLASRPSQPVLSAWIPGYPPIDVSVDDGDRLRARGPALKELAIEAARRGVPLRLEGAREKGVLYPASRTLGGFAEVAPGLDAFHLQGADEWLVWFRGLWLDARLGPVAEASDQRALWLTNPLPCDGRLGLDVGPFLPLRILGGPAAVGVVLQDGERISRLERRGERLTGKASGADEAAWRPSSAGRSEVDVLYGSKWGLHPEWPRQHDGRYAWEGRIFEARGDAFAFLGWLLDPSFAAPPSAPFDGYGFRAGLGVAGRILVTREHAPPLPEAVLAEARRMLEAGARAPSTVATDRGSFVLTAGYDDPRGKPVEVEVELAQGRPSSQIRLFRRA